MKDPTRARTRTRTTQVITRSLAVGCRQKVMSNKLRHPQQNISFAFGIYDIRPCFKIDETVCLLEFTFSISCPVNSKSKYE